MGILSASIIGGAVGYLTLRSRKHTNLINAIKSQADQLPADATPSQRPVVSTDKTRRGDTFYQRVREQIQNIHLPTIDLLNPDTLLPRSHREPTSLVGQLASPWQEAAATAVSGHGKAIAGNKQNNIATDDWQRYRRYLITYWRPYWKLGAVSVGLGISFSLYRIAFASALKVMLESIGTLKAGTVLIILLKFLLALPVIFAITVLGELLARRITSRLTNDLRYDMFEHAQSLSLDYYKRNKLGDLLSRFSVDMTHVELGMGTEVANMAVKGASILAYLIALFILEWHLALFVLLFMPASVYLLRRYTPNVMTANRRLRQSEGAVLSVVQEGISAQPIVQSFGIRQSIQDGYWQELRKLERDSIDAGFQISVFQNYSLSSIYLLDVSSMGLGVLLVIGGVTSLATLLAFQTLIATMRRDVTFISSSMNQIIQSVAAVGRVDQLLQTPAELIDAEDARVLPRFYENIRFEDVSFSYTGEERQLNDINLTIEAGQFVAFVGPSGAGKSTIFNLLMRFYDVSGGRVTVDGHNVRDVTQASLRAHMGVVLQETFIFNASVLNNIRVVRPDATEIEVAEAAKAAELHEFIMSLPEGYKTNVGEGGGKLSGGQKQRIAIARAMLCNPDILLLDEATSSLDADTAASINATIHDLARSRTVIAITHHLASVVNADKIYVLDQGHLVEEGDHASLLAQGTVYAQLWQSQTDGISSPPHSFESK